MTSLPGRPFAVVFLDLAVAVARVDERREHFRALVHLGFDHLVGVVVRVLVFVFRFARKDRGLQIGVFVVREFRRVRKPVGQLFQTPVFVEGRASRSFLFGYVTSLLVANVVFVLRDFFVAVFGFVNRSN